MDRTIWSDCNLNRCSYQGFRHTTANPSEVEAEPAHSTSVSTYPLFDSGGPAYSGFLVRAMGASLLLCVMQHLLRSPLHIVASVREDLN